MLKKQVKIIKATNGSMLIRIPNPMAEIMNLVQESKVEIELTDKGTLIIHKLNEKI